MDGPVAHVGVVDCARVVGPKEHAPAPELCGLIFDAFDDHPQLFEINIDFLWRNLFVSGYGGRPNARHRHSRMTQVIGSSRLARSICFDNTDGTFFG